jgi:peptide/nickel transport system substrate-binding protein
MMRARTKIVFGIAAAAILAALIATPAFADKKDNSVRFASGVTVQTLDPYFSTLFANTILADQIWDTLIYRDPETGEDKGALATSWKWVGETILELELRQDVKFHNGATFSADDVVFTFNFAVNPENKTVNVGLTRWIDHVEKVNQYKVRIFTKQPFPAAIAYLANPRLPIYPHDYYAKVGPKGMNEQPVGTGPYRVIEHALGKSVRFERNPDYFQDSPKARPKIESIEVRFIPDPQTRVAEMIAGGLDLITDVARDQAEQLREIETLRIASGDTRGISILTMNSLPATPAPQLRDLRVRQAIMHAIDRETMVQFMIGGGARVLHSQCSPGAFGCTDAGVSRYAYDPGRARQLLAEAGYPNGFDIDLYAYSDRNQAEALIGYLNAVGIRARLRYLQTAAVAAARRAGKVALWVGSNANSIADASFALLGFQYGPDDMSRDPAIRDLLLRADSALDPDVRKAAYARVLQLIAERAYSLPLYSRPNFYLAAKDLVFTHHNDNILRFYEMSWE